MADNFNSTDGREDKKDRQNNKSKKILIFIIVFILVFVIVMAVLNVYNKSVSTPPEETTVTTQTQSQQVTVENPIDFDTLQSGNDEIYAWIKIDDTKVDYPIVQSKSDDAFYLRHKAEDKSWSSSGAIYTELANTKTFGDYVTVIYGHNGYSDSMFTTLHYFEKEEFFNSHPYFYIYTPTKRLKYQVVSAFKYDDRHILNSFDFAKEEVLTDFQQMIQDPDSSLKNVRTELDTEINTKSRIVVLSTCITNQKSSRYLV
ncbi:MAG: class B sortase [Eubacteriales bacterium]|nr:class B sortase [Eubacteriales bacterium]